MNAVRIALGVLVATLLLAPSASGVTIDPGVLLIPPSAYVTVQFSQTRTFGNVQVLDKALVFDGVTFGVAKSPSAAPRASLTITVWNPRAGGEGDIAVSFTGSGTAGDVIWFNLTGLRAYTAYQVVVDGALRSSQESGAAGAVSWSWASWSLHTFTVRVAETPGGRLPFTVPGFPAWIVAVVLASLLFAAFMLLDPYLRDREGEP